MISNKNILIEELKRLSNLLDTNYNLELNFRNHCYLRIAYDNTVQHKWDMVVQRPFVKHANNLQLENAVGLLNNYLIDKNRLLKDNQQSLNYRSQENNLKILPITLF